MIWVDYVIIGIIALSALIGLIRGLVREALSLVAWVIAIWVGITFAHDVADLDVLTSHITIPSLRLMAGFTALFIVTLMLAAIINFFIAKLVDKTGLSGTDHVLGVLFGIARGVALVAIIVMLAGATFLVKDPWWKESVLIDDFQNIAVWLRGFLPDDMAKDFSFDVTDKTVKVLDKPKP